MSELCVVASGWGPGSPATSLSVSELQLPHLQKASLTAACAECSRRGCWAIAGVGQVVLPQQTRKPHSTRVKGACRSAVQRTWVLKHFSVFSAYLINIVQLKTGAMLYLYRALSSRKLGLFSVFHYDRFVTTVVNSLRKEPVHLKDHSLRLNFQLKPTEAFTLPCRFQTLICPLSQARRPAAIPAIPGCVAVECGAAREGSSLGNVFGVVLPHTPVCRSPSHLPAVLSLLGWGAAAMGWGGPGCSPAPCSLAMHLGTV
ncbi:hypothetical protein Cadr_000001217 [Camelus dromedarius]|uniref:Uncharacterized protein n=1 Tax=Camelus dromedarius TaxID=9838 RepID=A0A5N4EIC3_CAMDR|nr:hypothetical protein Cadr_000001217 [Camelus dromedarius]